MATKLKINYLRASDLPGVDFINKITVSADSVIDIKCHSTGGQVYTIRHDFSDAVVMEDSGQSPNGYADLIYRYLKTADDLTVWVACVVPDDTELPVLDYQEYEVLTFPTHVFLAEGEQEVLSVPTSTAAWVTALGDLSYSEKQDICVREVNAMLLQKDEDLIQATRAIDLNSEIPKHVGLWWRVAIAVIKRFFQDEDIDPLIVAEMAKQAAAGPTTRSDQFMLLRNLQGLITQFPTGPPFAAIWVETRNLNNPSDVRRKTILEVLQTRGTAADETYPLEDGFDSTDESWIVANQPGVVSYNNDAPATGQAMQATLHDNDGGLRSVRYRWQEQAQDGTWSDMSGRSNRQRNWTVGPAGTYRCRVMYHDNYADDQEALGAVFIVS